METRDTWDRGLVEGGYRDKGPWGQGLWGQGTLEGLGEGVAASGGPEHVPQGLRVPVHASPVRAGGRRLRDLRGRGPPGGALAAAGADPHRRHVPRQEEGTTPPPWGAWVCPPGAWVAPGHLGLLPKCRGSPHRVPGFSPQGAWVPSGCLAPCINLLKGVQLPDTWVPPGCLRPPACRGAPPRTPRCPSQPLGSPLGAWLPV